PTTSDEKTNGTTVISKIGRNNLPMGSVNCTTIHSTRGLPPPKNALTATPVAAPMISPSRMRVCDMNRDLSTKGGKGGSPLCPSDRTNLFSKPHSCSSHLRRFEHFCENCFFDGALND